MSGPAPEARGAGDPAVQPAGPCDVLLLAELNQQCFLAEGRTSAAGTPWSARSMAEILALPGAFGLIAVEAGAPVGFLLARAVLEDAEILSLGVLAAHRRAGHGHRLLRAAAAGAAARGSRRLLLEVAAPNAAARAFYLAEGFATIGHRRNYYQFPDGRSVDAVVCALIVESPQPQD